jgi:hypothetical protein
MMEAVRTSETSVDNHFTWQYIPEDNSEHQTRRRENLKSHKLDVIKIKSRTSRNLLNFPPVVQTQVLQNYNRLYICRDLENVGNPVVIRLPLLC